MPPVEPLPRKACGTVFARVPPFFIFFLFQSECPWLSRLTLETHRWLRTPFFSFIPLCTVPSSAFPFLDAGFRQGPGPFLLHLGGTACKGLYAELGRGSFFVIARFCESNPYYFFPFQYYPFLFAITSLGDPSPQRKLELIPIDS